MYKNDRRGGAGGAGGGSKNRSLGQTQITLTVPLIT